MPKKKGFASMFTNMAEKAKLKEFEGKDSANKRKAALEHMKKKKKSGRSKYK